MRRTSIATVIALLVPLPVGAQAQTAAGDHVHLAFAYPSAPDPCHGGSRRNVPPEGYLYLVACTFDSADSPTSTADDAQVLRWGATGPISLQALESETPDDGQTRATVSLEAVGTGEVHVDLCADSTCAIGSSDSVVIPIVHSDPPTPRCSDGVDNDEDGLTDHPEDPTCSSPEGTQETGVISDHVRYARQVTIAHRPRRGELGGGVHSTRAGCYRQAEVVVKRVSPDRDPVVRTAVSGRDGRWSTAEPGRAGRYYAVVLPKRFVNERGDLIRCIRDRSPTIRVH